MSIPISQLPEVSTLSSDAVFPVVENEETSKITKENLQDALNPAADWITSVESITNQASSYNAGKSVNMVWTVYHYHGGDVVMRGKATFSNTQLKYNSNKYERVYLLYPNVVAPAAEFASLSESSNPRKEIVLPLVSETTPGFEMMVELYSVEGAASRDFLSGSTYTLDVLIIGKEIAPV